MAGMFESDAPLSERPAFRWIESVEDVSALFGGRTAQQVFELLIQVVEETQTQTTLTVQDDDRSA